MSYPAVVWLDAGVPITTWPVATGGGGEINVRVDPSFTPAESGHYLVTFHPDVAGSRPLHGSFTFRRCADLPVHEVDAESFMLPPDTLPQDVDE